MQLQICRSRFSFEPAGMFLFFFIPAVWQGYARCSSLFLQFLWDGCELYQWNMKTKIRRIMGTGTAFLCTALLWGCASSRVDQAPQNESHENISPEQRAAVLKALRLHANRDLYITPNIPPNKLANARQSCAVAADDEVLGLLDTSAMRNAKSCLLVATSGIYAKNDLIANSPGRSFLPYSGFVDGGLKRSQRNEVSIGGVNFNLAWSSIPKDELIQMLSAVQASLRR
jgi:hypothetical protein